MIGSRNLPSRESGPRAVGDAEHQAHARTVDVRVEQPHARPSLLKGQRQVDRGGGLADTSLSGSDGDYLSDTLHRAAFSLAARPGGRGKKSGRQV
jgi:hypothetical protein